MFTAFFVVLMSFFVFFFALSAFAGSNSSDAKLPQVEINYRDCGQSKFTHMSSNISLPMSKMSKIPNCSNGLRFRSVVRLRFGL